MSILNGKISTQSLELLTYTFPFLFKSQGLETKTITIQKKIIIRTREPVWTYSQIQAEDPREFFGMKLGSYSQKPCYYGDDCKNIHCRFVHSWDKEDEDRLY